MVSDIIHICNLSIDFQFRNVFCCSILIMVQGEFFRVLEALAFDERISQTDRGTIFKLFPFFGVTSVA
jgi:hypothetical protein